MTDATKGGRVGTSFSNLFGLQSYRRPRAPTMPSSTLRDLIRTPSAGRGMRKVLSASRTSPTKEDAFRTPYHTGDNTEIRDAWSVEADNLQIPLSSSSLPIPDSLSNSSPIPWRWKLTTTPRNSNTPSPITPSTPVSVNSSPTKSISRISTPQFAFHTLPEFNSEPLPKNVQYGYSGRSSIHHPFNSEVPYDSPNSTTSETFIDNQRLLPSPPSGPDNNANGTDAFYLSNPSFASAELTGPGAHRDRPDKVSNTLVGMQ